MKKLSVIVSNDVLTNLNVNGLISCLKSYQNESFIYNSRISKEVSENMQRDTICSKWSEYLIFESTRDSLFQAKVFLRLNDDGLELFNINSNNPKYAILTDKQYNTIVKAFKKFIGESISTLFEEWELE